MEKIDFTLTAPQYMSFVEGDHEIEIGFMATEKEELKLRRGTYSFKAALYNRDMNYLRVDDKYSEFLVGIISPRAAFNELSREERAYFDPNKINLKFVQHYKDGKRQNPDPVTPAFMSFDARTGLIRSRRFYDGGELHDPAPGKPAWCETWSDTGYLHKVEHYNRGKMQDPHFMKPAYLSFDADTGFLTERIHYQLGKRHDPAPGVAAHETFDRESGRKSHSSFFQNDILTNPAPAIPAFQRFDLDTGQVIEAEYAVDGNRIALKQIEIHNLNRYLAGSMSNLNSSPSP